MKTTVVGKNGVQGATESKKSEKEVKNGDTPKGAEVAENTLVGDDQNNTATAAPEPETPKVQEQPVAVPQQPAKPALNLEQTLELVADLGQKKIQRDKLLTALDNLKVFKIQLHEDADETAEDIFQRCTLVIQDGQGGHFTTGNTRIIKHVTERINDMCLNRLAEIEASIVLP